MKLDAEALPLYEKLIAEFTESEYPGEGEAAAGRAEGRTMAKAGAPPPAETPARRDRSPEHDARPRQTGRLRPKPQQLAATQAEQTRDAIGIVSLRI